MNHPAPRGSRSVAAPALSDAQVIELALHEALAQYRRYEARVQSCKARALTARRRLDANPVLPAPMWDRARRDVLRATADLCRAVIAFDEAYQIVIDGARMWAATK